MLLSADMQQKIAEEQRKNCLYLMEVFCRACGTGHLETPAYEGSRCRKCAASMRTAIYQRHPLRQTPLICT